MVQDVPNSEGEDPMSGGSDEEHGKRIQKNGNGILQCHVEEVILKSQ